MPRPKSQSTREKTLERCAIFLCLSIFATFSGQAQSERTKNFRQKARTFHTAEEFARLTKGKVKIIRSPVCTRCAGDSGISLTDSLIGTKNGIVTRSPDGTLRPFPLDRRLPHLGIKVINSKSQGGYWIGTVKGAIHYTPPDHWAKGSLEYFCGKRWLPHDEVTGIGFEDDVKTDVVWIETLQGYSRIEYKAMTFAEKSKAFVERVRARHLRHGLTASSHLRVPGDLLSNRMVSSDNDGLWTAIYVAAECFRYKVTGEIDAREYARQGMQAMMRLEEITSIQGFPARSFIKIGVDELPKDGEWHTTPDGIWRWKGDTSSDEIVGHYFVYPIYYDLVADEEERKKIHAVIERITNHIIDNGYQLIDVDGKRTTWGWWGPHAIWEDPDETGLRALHILSHLRTAIHITGNSKFQAAYDELIHKYRYHLLTRNQKINIPTKVNHSDDELAFLSYYPLLLYEKDLKLREIYLQSLERSWLIERPEHNPLWNFIYAVGSGNKEFNREESIRTLQEIPLDLITWTVTNSHRLDVPIDSTPDRQNRKQALVVLPYDELPVMKWNVNPYRLDGGNDGRSEDDGAFFLLPYWMGRYHKLIDE
jgi:hypothetical protein